MKVKTLFAVAFIAALSGCSSAFTSIEPGAEADTFYVTEINARPFIGITGDLLLCKAEGVTKMVCESID